VNLSSIIHEGMTLKALGDFIGQNSISVQFYMKRIGDLFNVWGWVAVVGHESLLREPSRGEGRTMVEALRNALKEES
jgi:hypothetical protein